MSSDLWGTFLNTSSSLSHTHKRKFSLLMETHKHYLLIQQWIIYPRLSRQYSLAHEERCAVKEQVLLRRQDRQYMYVCAGGCVWVRKAKEAPGSCWRGLTLDIEWRSMPEHVAVWPHTDSHDAEKRGRERHCGCILSVLDQSRCFRAPAG